MPKLTSLHLLGSTLYPANSLAIITYLQTLPDLTELDISKSNLFDTDADELKEKFTKLTNLTKLTFTGHATHDRLPSGFLTSLSALTKLTKLNINNLGSKRHHDQLIFELSQSLPHFANLQEFSMLDSTLTSKSIDLLLLALPPENITKIDLSGNRIGPSLDPQSLLRILKNFPHLTELNLAKNAINTSDMNPSLLINNLSQLTGLKTLNLSGNHELSLERISSLRLQNLENLDLSETSLGNRSTQIFNNLSDNFPKLLTLNLSWNNIDVADAIVLITSLQKKGTIGNFISIATPKVIV